MKAGPLLMLIGFATASPALAQPNKTEVEKATPIGAGGYDGSWTFEATTTAGNCPTLAPSNVVIEGGHVVSANGGTATPWGYVEGDGTIVARFTDQSGRVSRASGRLHGSGGSGAWSSSTDMCGGAWRAQRGAGAERAAR